MSGQGLAFADLLGRLYNDAETIAICTQVPGGPFTARRLTVAQARQYTLPQDRNTWWSANPVTPGSGRGTAAEVTRWAALYTDLDVKPGGVQDHETCHKIMDELALMLGVGPIAKTMTGHGWQPLWRMDPDDPATHLDSEEKRAAAELLLRRWGVLVGDVARGHEADGVDPVHELARVLRAPGTTNLKDPSAPVPALPGLCPDGAGVLTVAQLAEVLDFFDAQIDEPHPPAVDHPHDAWDALNAAQRARVQNYLDQVVQGEADEMAEVVSWPEGHTDGHKRGWQKRTADLAFRLARLAVADWTPWGEREAQAAFEMIVPAQIAAAVPMGPIWRGQNRLATKKGPAAMTAGLAKSLEGLATGADLYGGALSPAEGGHEVEDGRRRRIVLTPASTIKPRPVFWLWDGRIALGTLALLAGREGLGKSTLAYSIAAQVTRGTLAGAFHGRPRSVLVAATEDSWEHTIVPRLIAADADLARVFRVEVISADDIHVGLMLPRDLDELGAAAKATDAALLVLDPLTSRLGDLDTHKDSEVRRALEPLVRLADEARLAVLGLMHHNKAATVDPLQLVMGSRAFTAVARSVHTVVPHPDDDGVRLFGTPKNNLGRTDLPTLTFSLTSHRIDTDEGPTYTGRLVWGEEMTESIREAMRRSGADEDRADNDDAAAWLKDYLELHGGRAKSGEAKKAARIAGHADRAVRSARTKLGLVVESEGFPRTTWWCLREAAPEALHTVVTPSRDADAYVSRGDVTTVLTSTNCAGQHSRDSRDSRDAKTGTWSDCVTTGDLRPVPPSGAPGGPPAKPTCPACGTPLHDGRECLRCRFEGVSA